MLDLKARWEKGELKDLVDYRVPTEKLARREKLVRKDVMATGDRRETGEMLEEQVGQAMPVQRDQTANQVLPVTKETLVLWEKEVKMESQDHLENRVQPAPLVHLV